MAAEGRPTMPKVLRGPLHLLASLVGAGFVVPVLFTIAFALAGIYDSVSLLPLGLGALSFIVYWLWRGWYDTEHRYD